jgi:hypothetical protein
MRRRGSFLDHGLSDHHLVGILLLQIGVALHLCQAFLRTALGLPSLTLFLPSQGSTLATRTPTSTATATHHYLTHAHLHGILHTFLLAGLLLKLDELLRVVIAVVGSYDNTASTSSSLPASPSCLDELEAEEQLEEGLLGIVLILRRVGVVLGLGPVLDEVEALLSVDLADLAADVHFS